MATSVGNGLFSQTPHIEERRHHIHQRPVNTRQQSDNDRRGYQTFDKNHVRNSAGHGVLAMPQLGSGGKGMAETGTG